MLINTSAPYFRLMIDLHTHTIFSDGELLPSEQVRRAKVLGYEAIAITDHADYTNLEVLIAASKMARYLEQSYDIIVIPGVELTHVPPEHIAPLAKKAKQLGAEIVVVHGETPAEPVMPGTNAAAVACRDVDVLAHPGFITLDEARRAKSNDILLEITARNGHNMTNGHVARIALEAGAAMWEALLNEGLYVNLARPPATPAGMTLLRCSLCALHTSDQVGEILNMFAAAGRATGCIS
jgi:histidinol phosphatase-like PHP family hydrolase